MDIKLAPNESFRIGGEIQKLNRATGEYEPLVSKYTFNVPEQVVSTTVTANDTVSVQLQDLAMNKVALADTVKYLNVTFPAKSPGYARDFFMRLTVTGSEAPAVSFTESTGQAPVFDIVDNSWANVQPGANVMMFTETDE